MQSFHDHSVEELLSDPSLWHFGSWVDAMKDTGWEWWSSSLDGDCWTVNLWALSDPYSLGPLEYLCRVAGGESVVALERNGRGQD
jgi:hypothetical protein